MISPVASESGLSEDCTPVGRLAPARYCEKFCRALKLSVPSLNLSVTTDSPNSDTDRNDCTSGTPASAFSIGMVICCSTSVVLRPGHCVMACTDSGATPG